MHGQPRPARYLSDLTPKMSTALIRCHTTIVLVGDHHAKGISTPTIHALIRRELLGEGRDKRARKVWKPSRNGLTLIQTEEPRFLAARVHRGYTTNPALAAIGEPEAVDPVTLEVYADANNERHAAMKAGVDQQLLAQHRSEEQRLRDLKRIAMERGLNVRDEMRLVQRGLDAIEAKIRSQRAA